MTGLDGYSMPTFCVLLTLWSALRRSSLAYIYICCVQINNNIEFTHMICTILEL
jgi:hypothetical protein